MKRENFDAIKRVVDRAMSGADRLGFKPEQRMSLVMDLDNFDRLCPINWQVLADAPRNDFAHDVVGIWNHYDRQNDAIKGGFVPRCAASNHPDPVVLAYVEEGLGG